MLSLQHTFYILSDLLKHLEALLLRSREAGKGRILIDKNQFGIFHLLYQWFRNLDLCQSECGIFSEKRIGLRMGNDPTQSIEAQWVRQGLTMCKIHLSLVFWTLLGEEVRPALRLFSLQACEWNLGGTEPRQVRQEPPGQIRLEVYSNLDSFLDLISFHIV